MALSTTVVWEVRTAGDDTNGGGFNSAAAGTDRSQQDSPHVTFNGTTITATAPSAGTPLTLTGYTVTSADVGNILNITGGTNFTTGRYQITSVNVGMNQWSIDRDSTAGGSGSAMTGKMGGALASLGQAGASAVSGNDFWIKNGTYSISSSNNVSGGRLTTLSGTGGPITIRGYETTRGDGGTRPILQASAGSYAIITTGDADGTIIRDIVFDGNGQTSIIGVSIGHDRVTLIDCKFDDTDGGGISVTGNVECSVYFCEAVDCTNPFTLTSGTGVLFLGCVTQNCTNSISPGASSIGIMAVECISDDDTTEGFSTHATAVGPKFINCTANSAGTGDGFNLQSAGYCINCLSTNNGGHGFDGNGKKAVTRLLNCAARNNTGGSFDSNDFTSEGFINVSGDPYRNEVGNDFELNDLYGLELRGDGIPELIEITRNFVDIGAVQSTDTANVSINRLKKMR